MTPLEALRMIQEAGPPSDDMDRCIGCSAWALDEHKLDCPWLAMPQIIAALEAVEAFILANSMMHRGFSGPWHHIVMAESMKELQRAVRGEVVPQNAQEQTA